jgi:hypothetical protein
MAPAAVAAPAGQLRRSLGFVASSRPVPARRH